MYILIETCEMLLFCVVSTYCEPTFSLLLPISACNVFRQLLKHYLDYNVHTGLAMVVGSQPRKIRTTQSHSVSQSSKEIGFSLPLDQEETSSEKVSPLNYT